MAEYFLCHPDHLPLLSRLGGLVPPDPGAEPVGPVEFLFHGTAIRTSEACPKWRRRWVFPKERFVEYEASDEPWCRYFGIGYEEEDRSQPALFLIRPPEFSWFRPIGGPSVPVLVGGGPSMMDPRDYAIMSMGRW